MEKWDAELYDEVTHELVKQVKKLIEDYKERMKWDEYEEVLDIGCGPGTITAKVIPLLLKNGKVVGIDPSKEMIQYAKNQYKDSQLEFIAIDLIAENITEVIGRERFTKVYSFHALQWILEQRKALESIKKVMKQGGEALLAVISDGGMYHIHQWMSRQPKWRKYLVSWLQIGCDVHNLKHFTALELPYCISANSKPTVKNKNVGISPYHNMSNPQEVFAELVDSVGFKVIECITRPQGFSGPTLESLRKPLVSINMFLAQIPQELHEEYVDDYIECGLQIGWISKIQYPNETKYVLPYEVIIGFFQKPATSS